MRGCVGGLPRRRFGRLVGRDAGGRRLGADEPESGECTAVGEEAAPRSQSQRVDISARYLCSPIRRVTVVTLPTRST
jgi:hypothetical protein